MKIWPTNEIVAPLLGAVMVSGGRVGPVLHCSLRYKPLARRTDGALLRLPRRTFGPRDALRAQEN